MSQTIMVFDTPLNPGQYAYMCRAMEQFPEVTVIRGYLEYRGRRQPGYLQTDETLLDSRRRAIQEAANRAIAYLR